MCNMRTQEHINAGTLEHRHTGHRGRQDTLPLGYTGTLEQTGTPNPGGNEDAPQEHGDTGTRGDMNAGAHETHESTNTKNPDTYSVCTCFRKQGDVFIIYLSELLLVGGFSIKDA